MKRIIFSAALMAALGLSSCSDQFLEDKQNFDNVTSEVYNDYAGASGRVLDLYWWILPDPNSDANWKYPCTGKADGISKSTEEYSGFGLFVNPQAELSVLGSNKVPDYFHNQSNNIRESVWGRIRNCNDVIAGISGSSLTEEQKNELLGQAYFLRAWCYYSMVKWYGGVPIVTKVQDPVESSFVPRSTTKACIEFICNDLDIAADMLRAKTTNGGWNGDNYGRVTTASAMALKGRVLLLWASPLFNRANDESRWAAAYEYIKESIKDINACGNHLYTTGNNINGSDFAKMFTVIQNPEMVFGTLHNMKQDDDTKKNNNWERFIRPKNTTGQGLEASAMFVDMFPMKDGKRPRGLNTYKKLNESEDEANIKDYPFMNRDPRFYRTFAMPGFRWAYTGDPVPADAFNPSYNSGKDYVLWNYVWYADPEDVNDPESGNAYGADNLLKNRKGVYVRKRSNDGDISEPLYSFNATYDNGGFAYSAAPWMEIRYAEVLLNYAEAACGAGHMGEAVEQLKLIRQRVGYSGDCGLQENLSTDQAACMSAVLYERQIELAYEGKRFDDLRRWMLFDGGTDKVDGAPASWTLTGWGGNTCTWLGFTELNKNQCRDNMEFRLNDTKYGVGGTTGDTDSDPLLKAGVERPKGIDFRKEISDEEGNQLTQLQEFYNEHFVRKEKKGDAYATNKDPLYIKFLPRYYFLGFSQSALNNCKGIEQCIGWEDSNNGGSNGTFDPLAE